jgi:sugar phosphate isomerase/epimerase
MRGKIMTQIPVALQLYTVRDATAKDFIGTLKKVARIGFAGVELAGTGGLPANELKKVLDDLNLLPAGNHTGLETLEKDLNPVIEYNLALGNKNIVCPYLPEEHRRNLTGWQNAGKLFTQYAQKLAAHQLTFAYHNHAFEFENVAGQTGYDLLVANSDATLVKMELDVYWVKFGGLEPTDVIAKLGKRINLFHLKEMANDAARSMTEIGNGIIDFPAIFQAAAATNAEWYIVEQDTCARPSLESAQISFESLKKWGIA